MPRRTLLTGVAVAILYCISTLAAFAADPPTAEAILDRYVEVTGGKQAYQARKSEIMHGTLSYPAQGISGAVVRYEVESGLHYTSVTIPGLGAIEEGIKDGVAWERTDLLGARIKDGAERGQALRDGALNATAQWRDLFPKIKLAGTEAVNGEECYKVVLTPADGSAETMFFSVKTGLALKAILVANSQMGDVPVEVLMSDYKPFGGILEATKVSQKAAGQDFVITIQSLETNVEIPTSRFDFPPDVQAILQKLRK
ncbi:MAG: hypothetical protein ABI824_00075 [Acidobacteriota bacterium]